VATAKTLGIHWDPVSDEFCFKVNYKAEKLIKRHIVSTVARIFDPIGWLQPTILLGKCFMKKLSADSLGWDSEVPKELQQDWLKYESKFLGGRATNTKKWKYLDSVTHQQ
jgi:Pao retrotransposon peptidase